MNGFIKRNLKMYFRDKSSVLFSLLAILIIIGLYILFLGDVYMDNIKAMTSDTAFAKEFMDNWVMAGVLAVASATTTLGMLGTVVSDRVNNVRKDFYVSPARRSQITGGYLLAAYIVGFVMSIIAFIIAEIYIVARGGSMLSAEQIVKLLGVILLMTFTNTSFTLFVVTVIKSINAFTSASTIIGTLIGFVTGIYLPIGMLPTGVQWIIKAFPVSHGALLMRNIMTESVTKEVFSAMPSDAVNEIKEGFGMVYKAGETTISTGASIAFMAAVGVVFTILSWYNLSKKKN